MWQIKLEDKVNMTVPPNQYPGMGESAELPHEVRRSLMAIVYSHIAADTELDLHEVNSRSAVVDRLLPKLMDLGIPVDAMHHYARPFSVDGASPELLIIPESEIIWDRGNH